MLQVDKRQEEKTTGKQVGIHPGIGWFPLSRGKRVVYWCFGFAILLANLGCASEQSKAKVGVPPELQVTISGCDGFRRGGVCELREQGKSRELSLWIETTGGAKPLLRVDGRSVALSWTAQGAGYGQKFTVPLGAKTLSLGVSSGGMTALRVFHIAPRMECPLVETAATLRGQGSHLEALQVLEEISSPAECGRRADSLRSGALSHGCMPACARINPAITE